MLLSGGPPFERDAQDVAEAFVASLPDDPDEAQRRAEELASRIHGDVGLWSADGEKLVGTGDVAFGPTGPIRGWGHGYRVQLEDGRVAAYVQRPNPGRHLRLMGWLAILAIVVAIGTWPVSRRLTHRLEALRQGAVASDEVGQVAAAFDRAADRVERLVEAQRRVLASASHELRSPLARVRMTLEILDEEGSDPRVQRAIRDVEELNDTVGDVLDAARMEAGDGVSSPELVDLRELLEGAGDDVEVAGDRYLVAGDPRLLRRMLRNLVDNARKYGQPPIVARIEEDGLSVSDRGAAPPASEREAMFEPFYRPQGHAEGVHGGVGLGLSLVRQIARHHGGEAALTEHDGKTCVRVRLPRV